MKLHKLGTFKDPLIDRQIMDIVRAFNRPHDILTPDGIKVFRVSVDNLGNLITTDVSAEYDL